MRKLTTLTITLIGLALTSACSGRATADLVGYRPVQPDSNQLTVIYGEGPSDGPGKGEILRQDDDQIQIRVTFKRYDGTSALEEVFHETVVTLKEPIGSRTVVDEEGTQLPVVKPEDFPRVRQ
jgi:hypothetical protein